MSQPKLVWSEQGAPGYWTAEVIPGYELLVQPLLEQGHASWCGQIGLLLVTVKEHCNCYDEMFIRSESRFPFPDHVDAMRRCEEMAAEWLAETLALVK